ncbi:MAG: DNA-directed RNA polymerase subunit alpha [Elusimicrobiota bacterium]|nr:DNA-directed RNA polymerase subunit alpha [Elusimicrobiota bacterium]
MGNNLELVFPKTLIAEKKQDTYGKFIVEPFEPGYGHTVGNSLRRILLSSLEGAAITSCKIRDSNSWARHEFETLNNIKEDVLQVILNLRKIRMKMYSQGPEMLTLYAKGEKVVKAGDIKENPNIEILNPEQPIATLNAGGVIEMELEVNRGRGFLLAEKNKKPYHSADVIPIDALFSPVIKVNYEVENTRVGQRTDYDKLILEIWTDGSVTPEDALVYSSKILHDTLDIFFGGKKEEEKIVPTIEVVKEEKLKELLSQPIEILGLSSRPLNCLHGAQIKIIADLVKKREDEIKGIRNLGTKSIDEIKSKLLEHNLTFGMQVE